MNVNKFNLHEIDNQRIKRESKLNYIKYIVQTIIVEKNHALKRVCTEKERPRRLIKYTESSWIKGARTKMHVRRKNEQPR